MVDKEQQIRWDFLGLSTDTKPTPATSEKVVDGSTFYETNTSKLYVWYKNQWYEKQATGGGGATYTAGDNIQISADNVISATDTTYNAFTGTDGETAGTSGLVPAPATTDAGKFLKADGTWDTAGSSVNVVQSMGNSTTDVMSQDATTKMIYADPSAQYKLRIGSNISNAGNYSVTLGTMAGTSTGYSIAIGKGAQTVGSSSNSGLIAIGCNSYAEHDSCVAIGGTTSSSSATTSAGYGSVAIGVGAMASVRGQFDIGDRTGEFGYKSSKYRLLTGVHDGESLHDGATVAQGNTLATSAPTTSTVGVLGQLYTDTTNMHTYQCTAISGNTYTWTQRW